MRLRRLSLPMGSGPPFTVHDQITVVAGLDTNDSWALVEHLGELGTPAMDQERLDRLGIEVDGSPEPVPAIELSDLIEALAAEGVPLSAVAWPEPVERLDPGDVAVAVLAERLEEQRSELAAIEAHRQGLEAELEEERSHLDTSAAAGLEQARASLETLEVQLGVIPGTTELAGPQVLEARSRQLEQRIRRLEVERSRLIDHDTTAVVAALQALHAAFEEGPASASGAAALADELAGLEAELARIEESVAGDGPLTAELNERLESARARVADTEAAARPRQVQMADVAELEAAHDRVLEAERRLSGRFAPARARRALEDARAVEQEILDRLGLPTWSAYMMESTLYGSSLDAQKQLAEVRSELEAAEAAWQEYAERLAAEPSFAAVLERLEAVYEAAEAIVGPADDLEAALRVYCADPTGIDLGPGTEAADRLQLALAELGLVPSRQEVEVHELIDVAEHWLEQLGETARRRQALDDEVTRLQAEVDSLEEVQRRHRAGEPLVLDDVRLAKERSFVAAATMRVERHRAAVQRIAAIMAELDAVREREWAQRERIAAQVELIEAMDERFGHVPADADQSVAAKVVAAIARLCDVVPERVVERPLIVLDHYRRVREPGAVDLTELLAGATQLLVVADAPELTDLALRLGGERLDAAGALA